MVARKRRHETIVFWGEKERERVEEKRRAEAGHPGRKEGRNEGKDERDGLASAVAIMKQQQKQEDQRCPEMQAQRSQTIAPRNTGQAERSPRKRESTRKIF